MAKEWLALKDWEKITKKRWLDMLTRVVFPTLGELPVKPATPPVILGILKKAAEKKGITVKDEAKRTLFGISELAAETFRVDANPVHQWREALPKNKTQHKRDGTTEGAHIISRGSRVGMLSRIYCLGFRAGMVVGRPSAVKYRERNRHRPYRESPKDIPVFGVSS